MLGATRRQSTEDTICASTKVCGSRAGRCLPAPVVVDTGERTGPVWDARLSQSAVNHLVKSSYGQALSPKPVAKKAIVVHFRRLPSRGLDRSHRACSARQHCGNLERHLHQECDCRPCLHWQAAEQSPCMAQITQSGATISGTMNHCPFHGTVSDTTISWTQDDQQANPACLVRYFILCFEQGGFRFIEVGGKTSNIAGTVSGNQISASGSSTDNIYDPTTQQVTDTIQATVQLTLQRQ
jgi:hypothetical protein